MSTQIVPRRFGLKYGPRPTIALEYERLDEENPGVSLLEVAVDHLSPPTCDTKGVVLALQKEHPNFLGPGVVSVNQLTRLVLRLLAHGGHNLPQGYCNTQPTLAEIEHHPRKPSTLPQLKGDGHESGEASPEYSAGPTPAPTPDVHHRSRSSSDASFRKDESKDAVERNTRGEQFLVGNCEKGEKGGSGAVKNEQEDGKAEAPEAAWELEPKHGRSARVASDEAHDTSGQSSENLASGEQSNLKNEDEDQYITAAELPKSDEQAETRTSTEENDADSVSEDIVEEEDIPHDVSSETSVRRQKKENEKSDDAEERFVEKGDENSAAKASNGDEQTSIPTIATDTVTASGVARPLTSSSQAPDKFGVEGKLDDPSSKAATQARADKQGTTSDTEASGGTTVRDGIIDGQDTVGATEERVEDSHSPSRTGSPPPPSQQVADARMSENRTSRFMSPSPLLSPCSSRSPSPPSSPSGGVTRTSSLSSLPLPPLDGARSTGGLLGALPPVRGRALPSLNGVRSDHEGDATLGTAGSSARVASTAATKDGAAMNMISPAALSAREEGLDTVGEGDEDDKDDVVGESSSISLSSKKIDAEGKSHKKAGFDSDSEDKDGGSEVGEGASEKSSVRSPPSSPKQHERQEKEEAGKRTRVGADGDQKLFRGNDGGLRMWVNKSDDDDDDLVNIAEAEELIEEVEDDSRVGEDITFERDGSDEEGGAERGMGDVDDYFA